jgi:hypothetical protein
VTKNIAQAGKIEDDLSLDVDQKLNSIPFLAKSMTIRRIWNASQSRIHRSHPETSNKDSFRNGTKWWRPQRNLANNRIAGGNGSDPRTPRFSSR